MSMPTLCHASEAHCAGNEHRDCIIEETIANVLSTLEVEAVVDRTAQLLRRYFGQTRVGLYRLCEEDPSQYEVLRVDDPQAPVPEPGTCAPLDGSACGLVVKTRQLQSFEDLDPAHPRVREERILGQYGYGSLVCFPLMIEERVLGTLEIAHPPRSGMLIHCRQVAERLAQLVAIALHNSLLMAEVQRLNRLLDRENAYLKDQIRQSRQGVGYIAVSPVMKQVLDRIARVAPSETTVLIRGETGTGKEGLARLVHEMSHRSSGPFVVVNLGAIPETLIESELFGHEKGAFTGATRRKIGRFEQATSGTLFLDEVGDAPLPVQVKLLRALQERQIERLGGERPIVVDVRVVAATNRPLEQLIEGGSFRSDFYYRLGAFPVVLPPLRERREDLRPLVIHLLERHAVRMHRRPPQVPEPVWRAIEAYHWPGNVRELENFLEGALILSPGAQLTMGELPTASLGPVSSPSPVSAAPLQRFDEEVRRILRQALDVTQGKIYGAAGAAVLLGLKPTTLQGKLRKYGVR
jgi:formate hydrogenlyase transcriptional activator